jgi:hypothetical protein
LMLEWFESGGFTSLEWICLNSSLLSAITENRMR